MTGERCIDRDGRCFQVANFTEHDHVRRLPQNRAQRHRKGQSHTLTDLDLIDARQQVLHRVFHRDDLTIRPVNEMQT